MKKGLLIFLLFIVFSCNNKKKGSIQNNAPRVIETIGTHISPDSLKPAPIIYLSEKAGPEVIAIPTKTGSMRIRHDKGVDEKIPLLPIITNALPVSKTDLNWSSAPPSESPSKDQYTSALGNFTTFTSDQGLALDGIICSYEDNNGNLWFGTNGGGVSRYDGKSFNNFTTAQGLASNTVSSIIQDIKGDLWFGTIGGGVSRYDGKYFSNFTTAQGLSNNTVYSISQDNNGALWFGTNGGGVSRYDESRANHACNKNTCKHDMRIKQNLQEHNNELAKSFFNLSTTQGLANNCVLSIKQDNNGDLWFGTNGGGVSRYDKSRGNHPCNNSTCKHDLRIQQNLQEHNIELAKSFSNYTTAQGLAHNSVLCISQDNKGNLWFGTDGGGVSRYDGESFSNFTTAQGLANNEIGNIIQDNKGDLWFGTSGGGVSRYDGSRASHPCNKNTCKHDLRIQQNIKDHNNELSKSFSNYTTAQGLSNNNVSSISQGSKGYLWFGTSGGGVSRYDGTSFSNFTRAQGLANNNIGCIIQDKKGDLWFGTNGGGVSRYDGNSFSNFTTAQGLANNYVRSIIQDNKGDLWFGTIGGGVSRYNGNSFSNFTIAQGLAENNVLSICQDKKGVLWFGTSGSGVSRYDGKSFCNYTTAQGLANDFVLSISEDNKGNLWFGTYGGGVSRYDGNQENHPCNNNTCKHDLQIQQNLKEHNNELAKRFTNFTTAQGLANNIVYSIMVDKKGDIWVGTAGSGITIFSARQKRLGGWNNVGKNKGKDPISYQLKSFASINGLAEDNVYGIVEDKDGNIFIGTNLGFTVLKGGILEDSSTIVKAKYGIEYYNTSTGCPVKDMAPNNMFIDKDGVLWGGTGSDKTGLVRFDYAALIKNTAPPEVVIQNIKLNNENICWYNLSLSKTNKNKFRKLGMNDSNAKVSDSTAMLVGEFMAFGKLVSKEILDSQQTKFSDVAFDGITKFYPLPEQLVLPYKHNNVSFDFNAIETGKPDMVNYQYILEGYDKEWSPITKKNSASFGNIHEGNYTLKIKAQSPEGVWCKPVAYAFKVLPPWWRTWWMYSIDAIVILTLLFGTYRWRTASLRKRKDFLETTVVERTKEVILQKEKVEEQKHLVDEKQKEILDSINYAKRIQGAMLPDYKDILAAFPNSFVLFKPKDIVSGDFYFFHLHPSSIPKGRGVAFIAAGDCTGHGVPGAFMSMVGLSKLSDAAAQSSDTSEILKLLNIGIKTALRQSESNESTRDGMDIVLCSLSPAESQGEGAILHYAAANRPLYIIHRGETNLKEIKATKRAIGGLTEDDQHFETHEIKLQQGDTFYLNTDGFADQFSGHNGKKLMTKKFKEILVNIQDKPMKEQGEYLDNFIEDWKAGTEQVDDILVIGVRI